MPAASRVRVWDALMQAGKPFDIKPAGMLALDVARVEAGLLLIDVDFFSSKKALIGTQSYSPYEMGLARLVNLEKPRFIGQQRAAPRSTSGVTRGRSSGSRSSGPRSSESTKRLGLAARPSARPPRASRFPFIKDGRQVGQGDIDDMVAGAEEDDRAGHCRSAALRGRHASRHRGHGRGGAASGRRARRSNPLLQPPPKGRHSPPLTGVRPDSSPLLSGSCAVPPFSSFAVYGLPPSGRCIEGWLTPPPAR